MTLLPIVLIVLLFSCNSAVKKDGPTSLELRKDSIAKCINENDTVVNSKISVEYVVVDSFYTFKIELNGIDSTLTSYKFDCSTESALVPTLYGVSDSAICLRSASGQDNKDFLVAYPDNDKLTIKNYEMALVAQLNNNVVIYQDEKTSDIVKANFRTDNTQHISLPQQYCLPVRITKANILTSSNQLRLEFTNGKKLTIKL
jgi:hypothetical protein